MIINEMPLIASILLSLIQYVSEYSRLQVLSQLEIL